MNWNISEKNEEGTSKLKIPQRDYNTFNQIVSPEVQISKTDEVLSQLPKMPFVSPVLNDFGASNSIKSEKIKIPAREYPDINDRQYSAQYFYEPKEDPIPDFIEEKKSSHQRNSFAKPKDSERLTRNFNGTKSLASNISKLFPGTPPESIKTAVIESSYKVDRNLVNNISRIADISSLELDLNTYKTSICPKKEFCIDDDCEHYHYLGERRRFPITYTERMCPSKLNCYNPNECPHSHNFNEVFFHPKNFNQDKISQQFPKRTFMAEEKPRATDDLAVLAKRHKELFSKRAALTKELECKLIEASRLKKKIYCAECQNGRIVSFKIPCGHGLCNLCSKKLVCPVCSKSTFHINI
jgi:hypothetical protein